MTEGKSLGGFDLSTAPPVSELEETGQWIEIIGTEGEVLKWDNDTKPVRIQVIGSYSKTYRQLMHAQTTKAVKRKTVQITGELLARQRLEVVAGSVQAWEGFYNAGKELDCSRENVKIVLDGFPYIMEQVEAALEDHEAFSPANSSN
jgi:hypothetical protein